MDRTGALIGLLDAYNYRLMYFSANRGHSNPVCLSVCYVRAL